MKKYLLLAFLCITKTHTEPNALPDIKGELTWQAYLDRYNQNDDTLRQEMSEKSI